jgi:hypothetical protein
MWPDHFEHFRRQATGNTHHGDFIGRFDTDGHALGLVTF